MLETSLKFEDELQEYTKNSKLNPKLKSSRRYSPFQVDQKQKSIEHIFLQKLDLYGSLFVLLEGLVTFERRFKLGSELPNNAINFESKGSSAGFIAPTTMQAGIFSPFERFGFHLFVLYSFHENAHIVAEKTYTT